MFYIGSGSITVESCSITEEALKAVNPGFVISGDSSHKTSVDFIIDIQYTEHDIGCYADPIELTGTFERIHFTFPYRLSRLAYASRAALKSSFLKSGHRTSVNRNSEYAPCQRR